MFKKGTAQWLPLVAILLEYAHAEIRVLERNGPTSLHSRDVLPASPTHRKDSVAAIPKGDSHPYEPDPPSTKVKRDVGDTPSVVQDWSLVCEQLCGAGLGGRACGPRCVYIEHTAKNVSPSGQMLLEMNRPPICSDLCKNALGGKLCDCKSPIQSARSMPLPDLSIACRTFCDNSGRTLNGCSTCTVKNISEIQRDRRSVSSIAAESDSNTSVTTPPSTTPDWDAFCVNLCKNGQGGALCNCDLPPFF